MKGESKCFSEETWKIFFEITRWRDPSRIPVNKGTDTSFG